MISNNVKNNSNERIPFSTTNDFSEILQYIVLRVINVGRRNEVLNLKYQIPIKQKLQLQYSMYIPKYEIDSCLKIAGIWGVSLWFVLWRIWLFFCMFVLTWHNLVWCYHILRLYLVWSIYDAFALLSLFMLSGLL